ncbi:MAG: hypothetical protein FWD61_01915 [Phycisphaerales bacterium]|nr:hypothetical protein [Phycisphaerales bacterium]
MGGFLTILCVFFLTLTLSQTRLIRADVAAHGEGIEGTAGPAANLISVTTGKFTPLNQPEIAYTATAGYMPLKEETGKLRAQMFYIAYTKGAVVVEGKAVTGLSVPDSSLVMAVQEPKRPIIFLFNGGPGAASVWLHLGTVGPQRLDVPADGTPPKAPYQVVENASSWLSAADLVFVDPVETGYSRPADPEKAKEFFGVQEDIASVAEFVRLYLTKHQRWSSPIFLAGESYGTTRVAALASYLQEKTGVTINGIILMSTVLNFAVLSPRDSNDLPFPLFLPTYTALARFHGKIAGDEGLLKEAESFAINEYTVALAKGDSLPESDRKAVAKKLSHFTGLSESYILESNLRVRPDRFQKELLRDQRKLIGRFDGRLTGMVTDQVNDSAEYDPSLAGFYTAYTSAFNDYVRRVLKYDNDLPYEVLSNRTRPWNFGSGGWNGYLYVGDHLRDAMTRNPNLKVLVCSGHYDLATPYFGTDYTMDHLGLPPELRKHITQKYYPGGHMMYHVQEARESLYKDVESFIAK